MMSILRRWRALTWRHYFYAAACGFFVILVGFTESSLMVFVMPRMALLIFSAQFAVWGIVFLLAITAADAVGSGRWLRYLVACVIAAAICAAGNWALHSPPLSSYTRLSGIKTFLALYSGFFPTLFPGTLVAFLWVRLRDAREAQRRLTQMQEAAAEMQREAAGLEMRVAGESIDSGGVVRSLREIRLLYEKDAAAAGQQLDALAAQLRAAIPRAG